jgi:hypothetical protein
MCFPQMFSYAVASNFSKKIAKQPQKLKEQSPLISPEQDLMWEEKKI